uniref:Uncharacterized protein n=1 Tax=Meloidogyne incognita TaxID=6306 RepID=A0A914KQS6_MELIC
MENQTSALFTTTSTSNLENGNCTVESRVPASSVLSFSSTTSSADICVEIDDENNADRDTSSSLKRPLEEQEVCSVCNDVATGYHYGTPSCNGCKTFFRRTVMKKQVFQCQFDGNCPVDKNVRCACRHCRFKKCLEAGMSKESIQNNRDPIGYTKRTRRILNQFPPFSEEASSGITASSSGITADTPTNSLIPSNATMPSFTPSQTSFNPFMNPIPNVSSNNNTQLNRPQTSSSTISQQQTSDVEHVQEDLLNSKLNVQKSLNDLLLNSSIFEDQIAIKKMAAEVLQMPSALKRADQKDHLFWHERDWFIMIEWAKMLPVYQNLDLKDKLSLLRHSAITFPSLVQCFYTPDVGPDTIVFPDGTFFDRTMNSDKSLGFQRKNFKMLDNLLEPIRRIKIDQNEFAGARAVFFLNPGNFEYDSDADDLSMSAKSQIAIARSAITNALYRYMVQKRGAAEAADKFGKLMLLGTAIATMSCEMREAVSKFVADFFEQIQFSDFARQILFSNNCDNIINNPLIIQQQQQQQSAITNIPNYNLNQNSIASLTNNNHHQKQQQPPNSSTISSQTQSLLVAVTPQTSLNGMLLGGNTPAVNNNTPMNVLNGLSNYFANGIQQQQHQQSLQQTQQQQPQTVFPLPQLQQQIIEQTQKQSFQQHQRQQQQQITNNFVQQQLYFSQHQHQQNTPIQFINNSFPTSINPSTLQQQQHFRQIQLQQQLHQQQHFNQPTIVPYPTQQHPQPSPHQQQQQPNTPQLSQPTSLRQPTPHSQTNPVRTPQNSVVSPGRPISRHPTPQQLAGTNWQQAQLVQNQNNNVPPQTQFDQAYIYQTKLFDASPLQKVFQASK